MASESVTIPAAAIPVLRRMLSVGQAALAEVERIGTEIELINAETPESTPPKSLRPLHPTGAQEMGQFAEALLWLESAAPTGE